jgi:hypothetical protein
MAKKGKKNKGAGVNELLTGLLGAALPVIAFIGKRLDDLSQDREKLEVADPDLDARLEKMVERAVDKAVKRALKERDSGISRVREVAS